MSIKLLKKMRCPEWVIHHSQAVKKKAMDISQNFDVDEKLIQEGALLHDIGRCKTNDMHHAVIGACILSEHGFSEDLIKIVERHIGAGISKKEAILMGLPPKDYIPISLEEKIVAHADNLLNGSQEVNLDFVITKWTSKRGCDPQSIERLKKLHHELVS
ncbi:TIGR00295 family protein [Methanobacterium alcaliphilum]|uniref:TIGR00295 family protein n=1 Tax=Methanobacterium alcaliphilum TaxID=392018 RepID=UPI00200B7FE2|nr:TIGR00295 family protein [Methanobacterium alcaliphilum]MCK9152221.1 TIGR00295 family protein [Methanobacterium alcaliphilum]